MRNFCISLAIAALSIAFYPALHAAEENKTPKLTDVVAEPAETSNGYTAAEAQGEDHKKLVKIGPDDEYDRGVPRSSVNGYFKALKNNDLERAANYLDLRNLPKGYTPDDGPELARQLKVVLDQSLWVEMELLSIDEQGHSDDGLPSYRDLVGQIEINQKKYDILLQRIPRRDGIYVWVFSSKTVRDIPELYQSVGYGPVGEKLSAHMPKYSFLGLQLWQWSFLLIIALTATILTFPFIRIAAWLFRRKGSTMGLLLAGFVSGPVYAVTVIVITRYNFDLLHPSLTARAIFEGATLYIIAITWLLVSLVRVSKEFWTQKLTSRGQPHSVVLLRPALTTVNILIILLALLIWLDNIGFSVTTVLAGLGIGGIAIALATQKSIENFIGALTLYLAAPIKVGDFCRVGDQKGTVEEIGLRATKLRTLENTVVTITNADFSSAHIENMAERQRFLFNPKIRLHNQASPDQIRYVVRELKKLLYAHSMVEESPLRVSFAGFSEYSLDIDIHCYIATTELAQFKGVAEDLNLKIMDIIAVSGTRFAIPAGIEYHGSSIENDEAAKKNAEQEIENLKQSGQSPTHLTDAEIETIKGTMEYPTA